MMIEGPGLGLVQTSGTVSWPPSSMGNDGQCRLLESRLFCSVKSVNEVAMHGK